MKIALLGDVSLNGKFDMAESDDVIERIRYVKELVKDCDYVIANLESPLTSKKNSWVCKGVYLKSNPQNIEVLKQMGVTHVTLANNHIFDYGYLGARETVSVLENTGIKYVGLGNKPVILEKNEDRAILNGFCCLSANGIHYGNNDKNLNLLSYEAVCDFLHYAKEEEYLPIVSAHFGFEHVHYPTTEHMKMFRKLAGEVPYVLHGNHPHAIQGFESVNDSTLFYALGNLCFDDLTNTSIGKKVRQTEETCKNYAVKIEVTGHSITDFEVFAMSSWSDGVIRSDKKVEQELELYTAFLKNNYKEIAIKADEELSKNQKVSERRNYKFYLARLNYKYIGAYINGKLHAKKYRKIYQEFREKV